MTEERGFNANYSAKYSRFARVTYGRPYNLRLATLAAATKVLNNGIV